MEFRQKTPDEIENPLTSSSRWPARFFIVIKPLAIFVIFFAIIVGVFRSLTPIVRHYEQALTARLSHELGAPLTIGHIETGWFWVYPVLKLHDVKLSLPHQNVEISELMVGVRLKSLLLKRQFEPGILIFNHLHLVLDEEDLFLLKHLSSKNRDDSSPWLAWLCAQDEIALYHSSVEIHSKGQPAKTFESLDGVLRIQDKQLHLKLSLKEQGIHAPQIKVLATFLLHQTASLSLESAQVYLDLQHANDWLLRHAPIPHVEIQKGQGDAEIWITVEKGYLKWVQTKLNLKDVSLMFPALQKPWSMPKLVGHLAFENLPVGFKLSGDDVDIGFKRARTRSKFLWHQVDNEHDKIYISKVPIRHALAIPLSWPKPVLQVRDYGVWGDAHDIVLFLNQNKVQKLNFDLDGLRWPAIGNVLGLNALGGHVHIREDEGTFDLNGQRVNVNAYRGASMTFDTLKASGRYKNTGAGLEASLETLSLNNQNLDVSGSVHFKNLLAKTPPQLAILLQFNMTSLSYLMKNWPDPYKNNAVYQWLSRQIRDAKWLKGTLGLKGSPAHIAGQLDFSSASIEIKQPTLHTTDLVGHLTFQDNRPVKGDLKGEYRQEPFTVKLLHAAGKNPYTTYKLNTGLKIASYKSNLPQWMNEHVSGRMSFDALVTVLDAQNTIESVCIHSNLKGVSLNTPAPLGKAPEEEVEVSLTLSPQAQKKYHVLLKWGTLFSYDALYRVTPNAYQFLGGALGLGKNPPAAKQDRRLVIEGELRGLDLKSWQDMLYKQGSLSSETMGSFDLKTNIAVGQLFYNGLEIGGINVASTTKKSGFWLDSLTLSAPEYQLLVKNEGPLAAGFDTVSMSLQIKKVKSWLKRFNWQPAFEANHANVKGQIFVPHKGPLSIETVEGQFRYELFDGRWVDVNSPKGKWRVSKLLNLLSIKQLPKRFMLNFKDVVEQGYPYSSWTGDFTLKKGVLHTKNTDIESQVYRALVEGDVNLLDKTYNLVIKVVPNLVQGSVPLIATMAGGPVVGAASFVVTKVANKVTSIMDTPFELYRFKIQGPWDKPNIS